MYLYLPHGVMKVVRSLQEGSRYTLWYPFQASRTVFLVPAGTMVAWWKGDTVWWVCLVLY